MNSIESFTVQIRDRQDKCRSCPTPCRRPPLDNPTASCPLPAPRWGPILKERIQLGDLVEKLAKPFAKALYLGCLDKDGKLKQESGCAKRRDALNRLTQRQPPNA